MTENGNALAGDQLSGKVAIITGAASGIGRATAKRFAAEGAKVVVADIDARGAQATVDLICTNGGEARPVTVDVRSEAQVVAMIAAATQAYGRLDILHNNAGVMRVVPTLADVSVEQWQETMDINLLGTFLGCKHGLPVIADSGGGSIINTITGLARKGMGWNPAWGVSPDYVASKAAVHALSQHIATIGAPLHVRVNCLAPTAGVDTPMQGDTSAPMGEMLRKIGLLDPDEVAAAALYLAAGADFTAGALSLFANSSCSVSFGFEQEPLTGKALSTGMPERG